LTEEKTSLELKRKGFDILEFNNAVEFRYSYESQYRSVWDMGMKTELVVILHSNNSSLNYLPFDLYKAGRKFYFKIADIFPNFSPPILEALDRNLLDVLYQYKSNFPKERIGDLSTIYFILKYVYKFEHETIITESDLMKALLHIHYSNFEMQTIFLERIFNLLKDKKLIEDELLKDIITKKSAFTDYMIEAHKMLLENSPELILSRDISYNPQKIDRLLSRYVSEIPSTCANHKDWLSFALNCAKLSSRIYRGNNSDDRNKLSELYKKSNVVYAEWLEEHFSSLIITPYVTPAMAHHAPHFIADVFLKTKRRQALIIIDGLALDQWITLRDSMSCDAYVFLDRAIFAWVPTLTAVSRQAMVSGKTPFYFPSSIDNTGKEESFWFSFWESIGLKKGEMLYRRAFDDLNIIEELEGAVVFSKIKAACFIINKIDDIMHGMEMGYQGFHKLIELYGKDGHLSGLIAFLLRHDFDITITSDHGNIDCVGTGNPKEGVLAETRGERVRIYKNETLRDAVKKQYPQSCSWKPSSLPQDYFPLFAMENHSFSAPGVKSISHGSISLQETIVPFVRVERK
jgi:hypothetical protein